MGMLKWRRMIQKTVPMRHGRPWIESAGALVAAIAAVKLLLHLYAGRHYGYFVDELYYLACANHLAWGYVDQPPLIALVTWFARLLLGDSLPAIRFFPALAGAAKVLLTGLIARELGGKRFAQGLAALCVLAAPGFLALDNFLTMNAFEPLFWMGCAWLVIRIVRSAFGMFTLGDKGFDLAFAGCHGAPPAPSPVARSRMAVAGESVPARTACS